MLVAVQMNPLEALDFSSDSTIALIITAQARGAEIAIFTPSDVSFDQGRALARARTLTAPLSRGNSRVSLGDPQTMDLARADVVLVRQEPPYDVPYHANTFYLEAAARANPSAVYINPPRALRNVHEKLSALALYELMPPTLISADVDAVATFAQAHEDTVVKPLSLFSGKGIFRRSESDDFSGDVRALIAQTGEPVVAQQFIPGVVAADKRVMYVDGQIRAALGRRPKSGGFIANIHAGGQPFYTELTDIEAAAAETVAAFLREEGIFFAGIDLIDGYLSEINVTCPTLIWELIDVGGPNIAEIIWDATEDRLARQSGDTPAPAPASGRP